MSFQQVATNISRFDIEHRHVHGYMIRISRKGRRISQFFSDKACGGKRAALKAAKERHAELINILGPVKSPTTNRLTHRNSTGHVGVHIAYSSDSRFDNCEYWAYCASWINKDGKREKISFAWEKYGETKAFELACLARSKKQSDRARVEALYERRGGKPTMKLKLTPARSIAKKAAEAKLARDAAENPASVKKKVSAKTTASKIVKKSAKKSVKRPTTRATKKRAR